MPEFILNSGGIVLGTPKPWAGGGVKADGAWTFTALDSFTQGYIEALFFTESEDWLEQLGSELEADMSLTRPSFGFRDLAPETLERIIEDCAKFQREARELLTGAYDRDYSAEQAGRDFWYTRNGHGVGFWDRDELEPKGEQWEATQIPLDRWTPELRKTRERLEAESLGNRLSKAARAAGMADAYLGDDKKVHLS